MELVSRISFSKKIAIITTILLLGSTGFQFYPGSQAYGQETTSIEFPIDSITKILNFIDKANAALAEGDMELVSQSLGEIETEVRDQLDEINVPLNSTSPR